MQPGEDLFKFMREIDRLAANIHRLGDNSVTELRKCVIIVAELFVSYQFKVRVLKNSPTDLETAEIELVVGNQYNRRRTQWLCRHRETPPRWIVEIITVKPVIDLRVPVSTTEGRVTALKEAGARRRSKNQKMATADKKGGGRGKCYVCGSEEHFALKHCGLCRSLEHRTCDGEEHGAEKGAMLAKMNVSANSEEGPIAATIGAARRDGEEKWDLDSGATFHMPHTRARMTACKKASAGTTVEVVEEIILPVDGFERIEMDLDLLGTTTKSVKMVAVAFVPGLTRNLVSTHETVE